MKALAAFAFGLVALVASSFATAGTAKADSFGFYVGSDGFGIQVSNYGHGYHGGYGGYYGGGGCWDPYYGRYVSCG